MPDAMHSASGFDRIEVVTRAERRRRWSLGEKLKAVEETRSSGMSVSYVARKCGISPSLLFCSSMTRAWGMVFSTLSLHHLPTVHDLESTFSEVARIVKPDGGIYLSDFGHLNSEKSMQHFAYQHRERQPELFTIDYLNSLRAAFHLADFQRLSGKHLANRARLYSTFLIPLMVTIKSPKRGQVELALTQKLAELRRALPIPQQRDLKDLIGLFKLEGLKSTLLA